MCRFLVLNINEHKANTEDFWPQEDIIFFTKNNTMKKYFNFDSQNMQVLTKVIKRKFGCKKTSHLTHYRHCQEKITSNLLYKDRVSAKSIRRKYGNTHQPQRKQEKKKETEKVSKIFLKSSFTKI